MVTDTKLQDKTLKELRTLAKARGLKGYSKLTKEQLVHLLVQPAPEPVAAVGRTKKARIRKTPAIAPSKPGPAKPATMAPVTEAQSTPAAPGAAPSPAPPAAVHFTATEEWVERTKYESRPNGRAPSESFAELGEDIDRLPTLSEPVVCLLPQKPGVLHAYWVLPTAGTEQVEYKLRLCRTAGEAVNVREEIPVRSAHGSWYFHVAETDNDAGMLVQLGYYRDGRFVSASGRSVAHLPSLYASTRTDERWWVSEADFLRMFLRAGGFVTPTHRFGWNASTGSPGAPLPTSEQNLAWPGGVSSSFK